MTPSISVKNLTKVFDYWTQEPRDLKKILIGLTKGKITRGEHRQLPILENVSFDVYPGEFVGIMGRNGVGKSTILKLISGIYSPTSGSITTRGRLIPLIELGAGFNEELSGMENIYLNGAVIGFGKKEIENALSDIVEFSGLGDQIFKQMKYYSTGMLMRLAFSIATHVSAQILLIDELLSVGDVGFQEKSLAKIHELNKQGKTILLVTHAPAHIIDNCSRCIVIDGGKKAYDGPPREGTNLYLDATKNPVAPSMTVG